MKSPTDTGATPTPLAALVRSVVGEQATTRTIARMVEARGGQPISHTTIAAILRGDTPSESTLLSLSLALGLPLNQLREAAGLPPLPPQPWANFDEGRVVPVPDLAAVMALTEGWGELDDEERRIALAIARGQIAGLVRTMVRERSSPYRHDRAAEEMPCLV